MHSPKHRHLYLWHIETAYPNWESSGHLPLASIFKAADDSSNYFSIACSHPLPWLTPTTHFAVTILLPLFGSLLSILFTGPRYGLTSPPAPQQGPVRCGWRMNICSSFRLLHGVFRTQCQISATTTPPKTFFSPQFSTLGMTPTWTCGAGVRCANLGI